MYKLANIYRRISNKIRKKLPYHAKPKYYQFFNINQVKKEILQKNEIIVYFFGGMGQTYQIKQWIDTFKELNKKYSITILVRNFSVYRFWQKELPFNLMYMHTIDNLLYFYEKYDPKVIIYINNGFKNFQSLIYENGLHIHINHGESDKSSDHSNQVKAYDYIFVHGPNGYNNYMKYLINIDSDQLIQTGRPQLDFIDPIKLDTKGKQVIMYAPTWEATHQSMRYTSVDIYGEKIVDIVLGDEKYFFIYKPHPNLGAHDEKVRDSHNKILSKIKKSDKAIIITDRDVNDIYPIVDLAIFDMSSIMTDYLNVNKPFLLADVFDRKVHKVDDYNVLKACNTLTFKNIDDLQSILVHEIENDPMKVKRKEIKKLYLGDYKRGESIKKFIASISKIITHRDSEIEKREKEISK